MKFLFILLSFILFSCQSQFNKEKWSSKDDLEYPYREKMVNDLTKNYKLVGLKYNQLIKLLGEPESKYSTGDSTIFYIIEQYYGLDIDPISGSDLVFKLSPDSTITSFSILKFKNK